MKNFCSLLLGALFLSVIGIQSVQAQRTPVFLTRKIQRLEATYETKCSGENETKRVCQIIQFRVGNVNKQITTFLLREQERKAQVKQDINSIEYKNEVISLTNKERRKKGLNDLTYNAKLEKAAQLHTDDMKKHDYFSHTGRDGSEPIDRINASGYLIPYDECPCTKSYTVGENIAKGQITPEQVVEDWMMSPDHRENILNKDYTEIGIGISGNYWGQNFGNISLVK